MPEYTVHVLVTVEAANKMDAEDTVHDALRKIDGDLPEYEVMKVETTE